MASVWKKGPSWYVKYRDGSGQYRQVRTTATTKTEAKRIGLELERVAERQRLGLEDLPADSTMTLGELVEWWLEHRCGEYSRTYERSRLGRHVLSQPMADLPLPEVTPVVIDDRLRTMTKEGLSATSIEHVRRKLRAIFNAGRKARKWTGANPLTGIDAPEPRRIPRRVYATLAADEVPLVMRHIAPQWQGALALAIYTGMRRGEIFGLRKQDVDLRSGLILVARSWGRDLPKGGEAMFLPIAQGLRPYLQNMIGASQSEYLLPGPEGKMQSRDVKLVPVLRAAMVRAGLVERWDHICRRCKAKGSKGHTTSHPDDGERRCSACDMRLWPRAIPRPVRWHDLRHTAATLLLQDGVSPAIVQRILRHADVTITTETYSHLVADDVRAAIERLPTLPVPVATRLLPPDAGKEKPPIRAKKTAAKSGVSMASDEGFEPPTLGFEGHTEALSENHKSAQIGATALNLRHFPKVAPACEHQPGAVSSRDFATRLLPAPTPLMTIREVAAALQVSTATVYKIVHSGALPSRRVGGAIRVRPEDLETFVAAG